MELIILDANFEKIGVVDAYTSLIWTDRFHEAGDMELQTSPTEKNSFPLLTGVYARIKESSRLMVIESRQIYTDPVIGPSITIKGRSVESLLDRRVVCGGAEFVDVGVQIIVSTLLADHVISPVDPDREISNFVFEASEDPAVVGSVASIQLADKDVLYSAIVALCLNKGIGFSVTLTDDKKFQFQLYAGVDRSYNQSSTPYVVFSPDFENLKNSTYLENSTDARTAVFVGGEKGLGNAQLIIEIDSGATGLARREFFVDAQDISKLDADGNEIPEEEYYAQLAQRGYEELSKRGGVQSFSSEVDTTKFVYGEHFFLGDVVQVRNEYGFEGRSRLVEVTITKDQEGLRMFPIFVGLA